MINSAHKPEFPGFTTFNVDLTGIALKEKLVVAGSPILNTPVLGALAKMGIISADSAKKRSGACLPMSAMSRLPKPHTRR